MKYWEISEVFHVIYKPCWEIKSISVHSPNSIGCPAPIQLSFDNITLISFWKNYLFPTVLGTIFPNVLSYPSQSEILSFLHWFISQIFTEHYRVPVPLLSTGGDGAHRKNNAPGLYSLCRKWALGKYSHK